MVGQLISHYKIIKKLGEGGMGVVYQAFDTKLKRKVALKFLPLAISRDQKAKDLFIHEAQTASALQHDNICTIHDIDETDDGQIFIIMDYYQGETLKAVIGRKQLAIEKVVNIVMQIAVGLIEAHAKGIIHQDIKPANVIITNKGQAKIMDFGLAKLKSKTRRIRTCSTPGTVLYMSPEQVIGEAVDQRTDIWSLGVILYEMICGQAPFKGEYDQIIIYSLINEEPPQLTEYRKLIPERLKQIVGKCLEKDPTQRYQNLNDFMRDLYCLQKSQGWSSDRQVVRGGSGKSDIPR